MVGDFNLHHERWNIATNPAKAAKAQKFVDWLDKNKAELIIDIEEINQHGGTLLRDNLKQISVIDLAFIIRSQFLISENWHYISHTGSDHEAISFDIFAKYRCQQRSLTNLELVLGLPL